MVLVVPQLGSMIMVYLVALVSLLLLIGGIAVIASMIVPSAMRIADILVGPRKSISFARPATQLRVVSEPRVIAVRPLLRAVA